MTRSLCLVVSSTRETSAYQLHDAPYIQYKSYHPSVRCYPVTAINAATNPKAYECLGACLKTSYKGSD